MPNLANLLAGNTTHAGARAAVTRPPDDPYDALTVTWAAPADQDIAEQDAAEVIPAGYWLSNGRLPASGDVALLLIDLVGDPWALIAGTGDPMWAAA